MGGQGLKVDVESCCQSTMTFDEAMDAFEKFVGQRVLVSIADEHANACASVRGVMKRCLEVGEESETGPLKVFDIGVDGIVIVSRAAYRGARWRGENNGVLALQNGHMLLQVERAVRVVDEELIADGA